MTLGEQLIGASAPLTYEGCGDEIERGIDAMQLKGRTAITWRGGVRSGRMQTLSNLRRKSCSSGRTSQAQTTGTVITSSTRQQCFEGAAV